HHFGGNPNDITLMGQSAGSMSIGALILMEQTRSLFKRAIMSSGSPNAECNSPSKALYKSKTYAKKLNCLTDDINAMMKCLKAKSLKELVLHTQGDLFRNEHFTPVCGADELLPHSIVKMAKKSSIKVDILFGFCAQDGNQFVPGFVPSINNTTL